MCDGACKQQMAFRRWTQGKSTAGEPDFRFAVDAAGSMSGSQRSAGACAAGQCLTGAPFPDLNPQPMGAKDLDKFKINAVRERRVGLQGRTQQAKQSVVFLEQYRMGIAHGYGGQGIDGAADFHRLFRPQDFGFSHVYRRRGYDMMIVTGMDDAQSGICFHTDPILRRYQSPIYGAANRTADPVAAHGCPGTISIIKDHAEIRSIGRIQQEQAVSAYAGVSCTETACQRGRPESRRRGQTDEVITGAVEFVKFQCSCGLLPQI